MATPSSAMDSSDVDMTELDENNNEEDLERGVITSLDSPKVSPIF